jgi:mxaJ protein
VRSTLGAGHCDVIIGVPASFTVVPVTEPYYQSTYVFVSRPEDAPIRSFDDPRLKGWRIGVQITGDDYDNPPAAQALAARQLFNQVRGFTVYGDYSREAPEREVIDAVANRRVDVAAVWGPLAGYFAAREPTKLIVTPTPPRDPRTQLPFTFAIAMAVGRSSTDLRDQLNRVIGRRQGEIDRILREYDVPLIGPAKAGHFTPPAKAGHNGES